MPGQVPGARCRARCGLTKGVRMADEMVLKAQRFINSYAVDGIPDVEENGKIGRAHV